MVERAYIRKRLMGFCVCEWANARERRRNHCISFEHTHTRRCCCEAYWLRSNNTCAVTKSALASHHIAHTRFDYIRLVLCFFLSFVRLFQLHCSLLLRISFPPFHIVHCCCCFALPFTLCVCSRLIVMFCFHFIAISTHWCRSMCDCSVVLLHTFVRWFRRSVCGSAQREHTLVSSF